jgi:hypothetical protein
MVGFTVRSRFEARLRGEVLWRRKNSGLALSRHWEMFDLGSAQCTKEDVDHVAVTIRDFTSTRTVCDSVLSGLEL